MGRDDCIVSGAAAAAGSSKGTGEAIAKSLSAAGAAIVVNYSSSKEGADRVVADITANGGKVISVKGIVAKSADMRRLFDETKRPSTRSMCC